MRKIQNSLNKYFLFDYIKNTKHFNFIYLFIYDLFLLKFSSEKLFFKR